MAKNRKEIEDEIAEYGVLIADKSVPQDEKDFAKGEIADLEKELAGLEENPAEKKVPAKAKTPAKPTPKAVPAKPAPTPKAKAKAPAKKKADAEHPTCEELEEKWNKRREQAKKAAKKHKTVSVSEQIGNNIASAVGKVIDDIAAKNIEKNPTKYIDALEKIEGKAKEFLSSLSGILGDDFDSKIILAPLEEIVGNFIKNTKEKYS